MKTRLENNFYCFECSQDHSGLNHFEMEEASPNIELSGQIGHPGKKVLGQGSKKEHNSLTVRAPEGMSRDVKT